jgi:predicted nucleic acid-binding protein
MLLVRSAAWLPLSWRNPRGRIADLMIAATALAEELPLFTANADDFAGLDRLIRVEPIKI